MTGHNHRELEEGIHLNLDFKKLKSVCETGEDLLVAVAQDQKTGAVLITGFANRDALNETLRRNVAVFYSTSRRELWIKGATSGDYLDLVEVRVNCEQNSLLYIVNPRNQGSCHTKDDSGHSRFGCYYRRIEDQNGALEFVDPATHGRAPSAENLDL